MTFLHKLSQRLARLKALCALAGMGLVACEKPVALTDPAAPGVVTRLAVSPKNVTLLPNQTTDLMAVGLTAGGDTGTIAVSWSVTGGTMLDTSANGGRHYGHYKAGTQPGQYKVIGNGNPGGLSDTTTVVVNPVPVASVSVSPVASGVTVGQTAQLSATTRDSAGNVLTGRTVTWASSNSGVATVTGTGLVTGVGAGSATGTATSEGKSGTATITVTTPPPPPPPPAAPGAVTDLAIAGVTDSSATLSFTEVSDGTGQPASYDIRFAAGTISWGSATSVTQGSCKTPVAGTSVGSRRTCTVLALSSSTAYGFQLVAYRGTLGADAVFGALSNTVSGTTAAGAPKPVASVTVSPTSASVLQGQTLQLTATIKDSAGNVLSGRAVTWTSSDASVATVSSSGLVGAVAAGSVTITATSEGRSGTAAIVVANTPVASVVVSPASAGVLVGGTVQLAASPRDAAGNALAGRTVTWASSNNGVATVNGSGVVTGVTVGSATITATSEAKSGTGAITVTAPPPPPGGTILVRETFEDGAFASRGWYDNTGIATTTAEHIPGSTRALEAHFPAGATTPTWGGAARRLFTETESVYLSYWVKYSANWVGSGQAFHPHEFLLLTNENDPYVGPSFTHLTAYVEHNYQNGGLPVLQLQDGQNIDQGRIAQNLTTVTENRAVAGCNGNSDGYATGCYDTGGGVYNNEKKWIASRPYFTPTPGTGYKSDWHLVEAFFQLNSLQSSRGVADGIVRYWFDGQLVIEHTNVLLRTGAHPNMKFNQLAVAPYIGSGSPVDQTMWVDDLTVASARP